MPTEVKNGAVIWLKNEADVFNNNTNESSSANAGRRVVLDPEAGLSQTVVSIDGNLQAIDTTAETLSTNPTANNAGASSDRYSRSFLLRWLIKLLQPLAGTVAGGRVTVDGSAVTQPVSAVALPLPAGAATAANQAIIVGHVDGLETLQGVSNTNTAFGTVKGGGTESGALRVTIATDSTGILTVDAIDLDIRNLLPAQDAVAVHGDIGILDQLNLTNSKPIAAAIVDATGAQISSFGGGTQYAEGTTAATATGTTFLWKDAGNALTAVSTSKPLPVTGSLSVSNTVALAVFKATASGTGYSNGDIIVLRQTPPAAPEYYNATTNATISAPVAAHLGPIATASNVVVDSGTVTANLGAIAGVATQTTLAGLLTELQGKADLTETQPISAAALPLPAGAATAAHQITTIGHLDGVEGLLTAIDGRVDGLEGQVGIATETAPTSDTASSGLNGRLQRIAQRITSLIALLPSSLGPQASASSLSITPATATTFPVSDNGGSLTVDAPANAPAFVRLSDGTAAISTLPVSGPLTNAELRAAAVPTVPGVAYNAGAANATTQRVVLASDQGALTVRGDVGPIDQITLTNATPQTVAIVDGTGTQISSFGGGTQYAAGTVNASPTGTMAFWLNGNDETVPISDAAPLPVTVATALTANVNSVAALPLTFGTGATDATTPRVRIASDQQAIPVTGTFAATVSTTPPVVPNLTSTLIASQAYAAGDTLSGVLTVTDAVQVNGGSGFVQSISVADLDNLKPAFDIIFYAQSPASYSTARTAYGVNDADNSAHFLGIVSVTQADYKNLGSGSVATVQANFGIRAAAGSQNVFVGTIIREPKTFASAGSLRITPTVVV